MPNSLDRTWPNLLTALADNNEGAIIEEDLRAVAAYSRHSSFEQAFNGGVTEMLADYGWDTYPDTVGGVQFLPLQSLRADATNAYQHYTGHLAEVAGLGVRYVEGDPATSGVTQPRQFTVSWSLGLEAPYNTVWGLSFWRMIDGGTWPGVGDAWPDDELFPLGPPAEVTSTLVKVVNDANVWGANRIGSITVTLDPGDTIVPVLEFMGTYDSTSGTPDGKLAAFTMRVASAGPVEGDWEATPSVGTAADLWAVSQGLEARQSLTAGTDLIPTGGIKQYLNVLLGADELPTTGNYNGRFYWKESTGILYVWKTDRWLEYRPFGYTTGTISTTTANGVTFGFGAGTGFAKWERTGSLITVRMKGNYVSATGGFTLIRLTGAPAPVDTGFYGWLSGQIEDFSASGAGRYPVSGQVQWDNVNQRFDVRPSSVTSEITGTSPITFVVDDFIGMEFSYTAAN